MSVATGWDHTGLLKTAGVAKDGYGAEIYLEAEQRAFVTNLVSRETVEPGEDLFIPKLGRETVTTLYAKTTTDGVTYTKTTDDQGGQITFNPIDDVKVQLQEKFEYVGMAVARKTWNKLSLTARMSYINGRKSLAAAALARSKDGSVLSLANPAFISSANEINSATPADFTFGDVGAIMEIMGNGFAQGEIVGILHTSQIPTLLGIEQFTRYNWTGVAGGPSKNLVFSYGPLTIFTHPDVYSDGADGRHGFFFAPQAVGFVDVEGMNVDDWYDPDTKSYKTSPDTDYAYGLIDAGLVATVQTPL